MTAGRQELGPGVWAEIVNGEAEIHVDLPTVAAHLGMPEAEAERFIEDAARKALKSVYGDQADTIPIETRADGYA